MMLLCWCIMLFCLSDSSESIIMFKGSGESVTLKCSSKFKTKYVGMYLYHEHIGEKEGQQEEVFFYINNNAPANTIVPRERYSGRINASGSFVSHSITISNLTVEDAGIYWCAYAKDTIDKVKISVYAVIITACQRLESKYTTTGGQCRQCGLHFHNACLCTTGDIYLVFSFTSASGPLVLSPSDSRTGQVSLENETRCLNEITCINKEAAPCPMPKEGLSTIVEVRRPSPVLIITACCVSAAISMLVTLMYILVIWPRVQQCRSSRIRARNTVPVSNDYVYEVMTKNGFRSEAAPEESSPYDFA